MPRRKKPEREPNVWQRYAAEYFKPSYNRDAGRILYGEHDVEHWYVVPGQAADGSLIALGYESEPVTDPLLVRWIDALMAFDNRERREATPLIALLESDIELPPTVDIWLADLVRRHDIKCDHRELRHWLACALKGFKPSPPTSGRPKVAAYDMTDRDAELYIANDQVTNHLEIHGGAVADAIAAIARKKYPSDPGARSRYAVTLKNHRERRNTSSRRMAKRRTQDPHRTF